MIIYECITNPVMTDKCNHFDHIKLEENIPVTPFVTRPQFTALG